MSTAPYVALRKKTLPGLLAERARSEPAGIAFRSKHLGIYRERTWRDFAALVGRAAIALGNLGLARGDRVAIIGDACEEWIILDLAAQACGAITYGIYPTASTPEVEYQLENGGAVIAVAENQQYVDKILAAGSSIRHIVVIDATAMFDYDDARIVGYASLIGNTPADAAIAALELRVDRLRPTDPAFIVYTSGTTGHPKGALVTHGRHIAGAQTLVEIYPTLREKPHRTVVYLPLCHVLGRDIATTLPLVSRLVPHFGESVEALPETLFEVAPTVLFAVPRYLQKFAANILVGIAESSPVKRHAYEAAIRIARAYARKRWDGKVSAGATLAYNAAHAAAFRPILNKLGLDRLELLVSGGAALPAETMALWQMYGVNVCEIYGQTETAGAIIAGQRGPFPRPGDVGVVPPGWEVRIDAATREILVRGPDIFEGYWQSPEATAEVVDAEGWLHTGDCGELEDGKLKIVDRVRDFIVTAGGKTLSPSYIENIVRASPYVGEVVVIGHGRKYLTALVEIDFDTVSNWARANEIVYAGFTSLAEHPRVLELVGAEIARANGTLARVETIKAFRILPKMLDPEEEGEPVTPTRKVKRALMFERFRTLVDSMYDDEEERRIAAAAGDVISGRGGST